MGFYRIAGLTVEMTPRYETLRRRAAPYEIASGRPDIEVFAPDELLAETHKANSALSDDDCEYIRTGGDFYAKLLKFNGLLLHASAVELDGAAYLFSADSGTGKSTHTSLWLKQFDRARIINDDKPALRIENGACFVYGTPWSGKTDQNLDLRVPLKAIALLSRDRTNSISPAPVSVSLPFIMEQTMRPRSCIPQLLSLLDTLLRTVPVYSLKCNMEQSAAVTAYNGMKG